ncbi:putative transcription factor B3-Domain family [Helianthus anomalus]
MAHTEAHGTFLSVSRDKAETIFPPMTYSEGPSSHEMMTAKDIHGQDWDFKHVFEKGQQRHKVTVGWAAFVKNKELVKGNSVMFTKAKEGPNGC